MSAVPEASKTCKKCEKEKPLSEFYKHPRNTDGRWGACAECSRLYANRRRAEHLDEHRARDKARCMSPARVAERKRYAKTPQGKAAAKVYKARYSTSEHGRRAEDETRRKYRGSDPVRRAAHQAVSYAVRSGKMIRMPCEVCGEEKAAAHHDDYSKPLDVRWLCPLHHVEWHKNNAMPAR